MSGINKKILTNSIFTINVFYLKQLITKQWKFSLNYATDLKEKNSHHKEYVMIINKIAPNNTI